MKRPPLWTSIFGLSCVLVLLITFVFFHLPKKNTKPNIDLTPYTQCNDIDFYYSPKLNLGFKCPKDMLVFECDRDINLFTDNDLDNYGRSAKIADLCRNKQGTIQIWTDTKNLYDGNPKSDPKFKVTEKQITIDNIPATRQTLEYSGSDIPSYSEFVTFSYQSTFYRIRTLSRELAPQFDQILSTFQFNSTPVGSTCQLDSDCSCHCCQKEADSATKLNKECPLINRSKTSPQVSCVFDGCYKYMQNYQPSCQNNVCIWTIKK